jgi:shikimate kinase
MERQETRDVRLPENLNSTDNAASVRVGDLPPRIALVGFMGTGKTTVGKRLAYRLGYRFTDSDSEIELHTGQTVKTIFLEQGETAFRALEKETLAALVAQPDQVISTGGGTVLQADNTELLRAHCLVVWLTASPAVILKRVGNAATRPLLANAPDPLARIRQLLDTRSHLYEAAAHVRVDTTNRRPEVVVQEIARLYQQP